MDMLSISSTKSFGTDLMLGDARGERGWWGDRGGARLLRLEFDRMEAIESTVNVRWTPPGYRGAVKSALLVGGVMGVAVWTGPIVAPAGSGDSDRGIAK